jgi:hypothetical protein
MEKSANKRWKESGTTLTFKQWIERENKKEQSKELNFVSFEPENFRNTVGDIGDTAKEILERGQAELEKLQEEMKKNSGFKDKEDKSKILGLNKGIVIFSGVIIVASLGFYFYSKFKKKNG